MINEQNVVSKVSELMSALDQVKKYRVGLSSLTDLAVIAIVYLGAWPLFGPFSALQSYFGSRDPPLPLTGWFRVLLPSLIIVVGWTVVVLRVNRKVGNVTTGWWKSQLEEGVPGALKLLTDIDSPAVYEEISLAKLGFLLYGLLRGVAYWIPVVLMVGVLDAILVRFFSIYIDFPFLAIVGLLGVFLVKRREILTRFRETWSLDTLLWDLRWFNSEFRRADFKA